MRRVRPAIASILAALAAVPVLTRASTVFNAGHRIRVTVMGGDPDNDAPSAPRERGS